MFIIKIIKLVIPFIFYFHCSSAWPLISKHLTLTKNDIANLKRAENQLNLTKTLKARFVQISSNGEFTEGQLLLKRPGKLRLVYDSPNPLMIIADGTYISFVDRDLDEATTLLLSLTQAAFLLQEKISFFSNNLIITGYQQKPGFLKVSITKSDAPLEGKLTLIFSDTPLELRKWIITDSQGIVTTVSLLKSQLNIPIDKKIFLYKPKFKFNLDN